MNGTDHYREAERLIEDANHVGHSDPQRGDGMLAAAQVHATLALAAATALLGPHAANIENFDTFDAWRKVAGSQPESAAKPGQVAPESAAPVRIDSLFGLIEQQDIRVVYPDWNDGKPVDLVELHRTADGNVPVTYGLPDTRCYIRTLVPADTLVTPA